MSDEVEVVVLQSDFDTKLDLDRFFRRRSIIAPLNLKILKNQNTTIKNNN